jgi:hypothetical protein
LITLFGGIIDQVTFYDAAFVVVANLAEYVMGVNLGKKDVVVYGPDWIMANSKIFMDEEGQFISGATVSAE